MDKYLKLDTNGNIAESNPSDVSQGSSSAGEIVALNNDGKIDDSMLPDTISPEVVVATAGEDLVKGDLVYICDASGTLKAFKAKANSVDTLADGFVLENVSSGNTVKVYSEGMLVRDDMTFNIGSFYFLSLTEAGKPDINFPDADPNGAIILMIGTAVSSNTIQFEKAQPIIRVFNDGGSGCEQQDESEQFTTAAAPAAPDSEAETTDDVYVADTDTPSTGVDPTSTPTPSNDGYDETNDGGDSTTNDGDYDETNDGGDSTTNDGDYDEDIDGGDSGTDTTDLDGSSVPNGGGSNWTGNTLYVNDGDIYTYDTTTSAK